MGPVPLQSCMHGTCPRAHWLQHTLSLELADCTLMLYSAICGLHASSETSRKKICWAEQLCAGKQTGRGRPAVACHAELM